MLVAVALIIVFAVAARSTTLATAMFAVNSAITLALLVWGLGQSEHSDGRLIAYAFAVELTGFGAVRSSRTAELET
jgi:hypothetical protein